MALALLKVCGSARASVQVCQSIDRPLLVAHRGGFLCACCLPGFAFWGEGLRLRADAVVHRVYCARFSVVFNCEERGRNFRAFRGDTRLMGCCSSAPEDSAENAAGFVFVCFSAAIVFTKGLLFVLLL